MQFFQLRPILFDNSGCIYFLNVYILYTRNSGRSDIGIYLYMNKSLLDEYIRFDQVSTNDWSINFFLNTNNAYIEVDIKNKRFGFIFEKNYMKIMIARESSYC